MTWQQDVPLTGKYAELPEPIKVEDMITSLDVVQVQPEKDDYWREVEWMLRTSGLG